MILKLVSVVHLNNLDYHGTCEFLKNMTPTLDLILVEPIAVTFYLTIPSCKIFNKSV